MLPNCIRPSAHCIIRRGDELLLSLSTDPVKQHQFYRPLGGGIEFGEQSQAAAIREMQEEIGAAVVDLHLLGVLENIFTYAGRPGHEIVFVYVGHFADSAWYDKPEIIGHEEGHGPITVVWKTLAAITAEGLPLYPTGLATLLHTMSNE